VKIQTCSVVVGNEACNADCPFCVGKMTTSVMKDVCPINERNFLKTCELMRICGTTTVLFTGKGEPTLFPDQITQYLTLMIPYNFPFIELQTNGIMLYGAKLPLKKWYNLGLTTVAVSLFDASGVLERKLFDRSNAPDDYETLVKMLHVAGLQARASCVMLNGGVDGVESLKRFLERCREYKFDQVTLRPMAVPNMLRTGSESERRADWCKSHALKECDIEAVTNFVRTEGTKIMTLPHGAQVFDYDGQNICLTDCLTESPDSDNLRQIIYYPDGRLTYSWQHEGARLL